VEAQNGTKIGADFLVSQVLKSSKKSGIFIVRLEWEP